MADAFNIFESEAVDPEIKVKPFFKILESKKEKEIHDWLKQVSEALINQSELRTHKQRENLLMYRGVEIKQWDRYRNRERNQRRFSKIQKFVVNHLYDLTETKVSQMTRLKPAVQVLPNNDEWEDRASSKVVQSVIQHLWYINNIDQMITDMHRDARIFGEAFAFVTWDQNAGDLSPAYVEARDAGLDVSRPDIQAIKYTGDVKFEKELPWRVLMQRKTRYCDIEYAFRLKIEPTEKLKKEHPNKKDEIKNDEEIREFEVHDLIERTLENHSLVIEFWHKKTREVPEGYYCKFTKSAFLEASDHPFSHGKLPFVRLTDLDVPDILNGVSRYETIAPVQRMYNNVSTLIAKNIYLTAHAKWVMPRGAAKIEQLGNDNTIVQYQGPVPPQLLQVQPNPPEVYAFRQQLVEDMQTIYGSHGISRGEVPKGITAASALQFLNELENERASTDISKHSDLVKNLAKMTIAVAGDYYDPEDGRLVRIVGQNNQYLVRHFDAAHLHKSYDIRFDNSTGLPETKAAKYQRILDAMQRSPNILEPERWLELLDLANEEKMIQLTTAAIQSADSENEDMLAGRDVAPPEEWEDHLAHWDSHVRAMQSRQFKEDADELVRAKFKDHVYWTEEAIIDKMMGNPEFEAKVATLTLFPLFYHKNYIPARSLAQQMATVQGAANRGEPTGEQIPGTSPEDLQQLENAKEKIRR